MRQEENQQELDELYEILSENRHDLRIGQAVVIASGAIDPAYVEDDTLVEQAKFMFGEV